MRRLLLLPTAIVLILVTALVSRAVPASAGPVSAPQASAPVCAFVCNKTGINTGWAERGPESEYLHAQQLGMGWIMEIAGSMNDVSRTAEAINRANAHGLRAIVRICSGDSCELGDPGTYSTFLHQVAARVQGDFWALMGPNEPDLEHWAGNGAGVAAFMNGTLDLVGDIPNLKKLSPAFNLTNRATPGLIALMEKSGARFQDLDGFAGTSYNLGGSPAYNYYAHHGRPSMRDRAIAYGKPFIFIETGTFAMTGKDGQGNPRRVAVVKALRKDFGLIVKDPTVMGVLYFNAFGDNPSLLYHVLYDPELVAISQDATCTGGGYSPVGVGYSTSQTLWQTGGAPACSVVMAGCPFVGGSACAPTGCVDNDGDGLYGDGGSCARTDCNDSNPAMGASCGAGAPDLQAGWGALRVVDADVPAPQAWPVIKLGADNLPVIGYQSGAQYQGDVTFLQCEDAGCTSALRRVLVSDNDSGGGLAMQVRADGRPIIAYLNGTDYYLETIDCADAACGSGRTSVEDINVGQFGFASSMALLSGDAPSMAYWASGSSDLGVVTCPGGDCDAATPFVRETSGQTGVGPTIFSSQSGLPYVVYSRALVNQLRLLRCTTDICSAGQKVTLVDKNAPTQPMNAISLPTSAVVVRGDGRLLILFRHVPPQLNETASLYDCDDPTCSAGAPHDIFTPDGQIIDGSIVLLPDGKPFIALADMAPSGDVSLVLIACGDALCASSSVDRVGVGNAVSLPSGQLPGAVHPDILVRPDGNPLVAYHDIGNGRLMVYDVDMALAGSSPQPTTVPTATTAPTNTPIPTDTPIPTETGSPTPTLTPTPRPLTAPTLTTPTLNQTLRLTPKFTWAKVSGAKVYQFEYAGDFGFASPVFSQDTLTSAYITPPPMDKGSYFWHVRAGDGLGNWSEWSAPRPVIIALPLPGKPTLVSPASRAKVPGGRLSLAWNAAPGASGYEIWVDTSSRFNLSPLIATVSGLMTDIGPLPPGVYYWRVRGLNADLEPGPWSASRSLTVPQ